MPIFVKIIITLIGFALGAFCIYGLTGLEFKEEKPPKARQIAVLISYLMIIFGIYMLVRQFY